MNSAALRRKPVRLDALLQANTAACALTAALVCAGTVNPSVIAIFCALFLTVCAFDAFRLKRVPRPVINAASVSLLIWAVRYLRYWDVNSVITTFTGAILLLMAIKLFEEKSGRNYVQILGLAVLALLGSAVVTYNESVVYYYFLMSVLAGVEFILISWRQRQPGAVLPLGHVLRVIGGGVAIWAVMLPICLAFFFLAPRPRAMTPFMQQPGDDSTFSGFSDQITLGGVKDIQLSDKIAYRAEAPMLPSSMLYWRGMTLEIFDGVTWLQMQRNLSRGPFTPEGETVTQKILMEPGRHRVFFALDKPLRIDSESAFMIGDGNFVNWNARATKRLEYTALSGISRSMKPLNPDINRRVYLNLPEGFMPELEKITIGITQGKSDRQKADAIMAYLAPPDFEYSLENLPASKNPLEEFILSSRKGNCEFFATAMAVMLRFAGVPSRLVAGYMGGEYNASGGYYIVSQADAHVWVEAWNGEASAWERRDPTPASALGEAQAAAKYNFLSFYIDSINFRVSRLFLEYDSESRWETIDAFRRALGNSGGFVIKNMGKTFLSLGKLAAFFASTLAAFFLFKAAKKIKKRAENRELALLGDFLRAMKRRGYEKKTCDGLEEFVSSIETKPPLLLGAAKPARTKNTDELAALASAFVLRFEEFYFRDLSIDPDSEAELRSILKKISSASSGHSPPPPIPRHACPQPPGEADAGHFPGHRRLHS
jgi:hypothetical protein